ncbi:MAG: tetratricopeptide repeat protein [Planctomycetota bacterium]
MRVLPPTGIAALALLGTILLAAPGDAWAQRNASQAEGEISRLLDDARLDYENLELDRAMDALDRAVRMGTRFDIRSTTMAEVYLQRGILAYVRDRNNAGAVTDFTEALRMDSGVRLDPMVSTPSLERLFKEAQDAAGVGGAGGGGSVGDRNVTHVPPENIKEGEEFEVTVELAPEINDRVFRAYLYYRGGRVESVQRVDMRPVGRNGFSARVPRRDVAGRRLSYYVVIEDRRGRAIAGVKSAQDPVVVAVVGDAFFSDAGGEVGGSSLDGGGGDDDDFFSDEYGLDDDGGKRSYVSLAFSLGAGAGYITDLAEPVQAKSQTVKPGVAPAPFHTLVELDFWATKDLALGAFGRIQIVEFAYLVGGRVKYRVMSKGAHNILLRAGGGVGRIRHLVPLDGFSDTTLQGPFGWSIGATYELQLGNGPWSLLVQPDFWHLFGESPAYHMDLNLGAKVAF